METLSLVLDIAVIALLIATICYAYRLNRHLTTVRRGTSELKTLIASFADASERAEMGIKGIRRAAQENGEALQKAIERAQQLRDELSFMIESGDAVASRIEGSLANNPGGAPAIVKMDTTSAAGQSGRGVTDKRGDRSSMREKVGGHRRVSAGGGRASTSEGATVAAKGKDGRRIGFRDGTVAETRTRNREGAVSSVADQQAARAHSSGSRGGGATAATVEPTEAAVDGNGARTVSDERSGMSRAERELLDAIESRR